MRSSRSPWPREEINESAQIVNVSPTWSQTDDAYLSEETEEPLEPDQRAFNSGMTAAESDSGVPVPTDTSAVGDQRDANDTQLTTDGRDAGSTDSLSEIPAADDISTRPPAEPTMLDRLRRGLYSPRIEDNTDKLRKQLRRWPESLGLLRDRGESVAPGTEDPTAGVNSGDLQTLESAGTRSGIPQSEASSPAAPLDTVINELEYELTEWPMSAAGRPERPNDWRRRQTDLRMLYLVAGRSAESVRVIEALPEEEQEFWQSLMLAVNGYRNSADDDSRRDQLNQTLGHLRTATRKLQPLSTLEIHRLTFCDRIDGFGNVTEFPAADFDPGQRVLLYAEVQNFRSELTDDGHYRSEFAAVLEFRREGDDEVFDTIRLPQIQDACSAERSDYFHSFELTLPALAGKYQVRLRLRDQLSLQTAESQLEFHVR